MAESSLGCNGNQEKGQIQPGAGKGSMLKSILRWENKQGSEGVDIQAKGTVCIRELL